MSEKLTKTKLKNSGENFGGYYLGGNVYNYENAIYYIETKNIEMLEKETKNKELIGKIKSYGENVRFSARQLFYSAGVYGNNGQLHKITVTENDEIIDSLFIYYC